MLIDWFTVAAQAINFLILIWLLKRFLYKPVLGAIESREKRIADGLAAVAAKTDEAQAELAEYKRKKEEIEQHRQALMQEAADAAAAEHHNLMDQARSDCDAFRAKLQDTLRADQDVLRAEIASRAQSEVFAIARKALADLGTANLEERIAEVFTQRLRDLDGRQREELAGAINKSKRAVVRSAFELAPAARAAVEQALKDTTGASAGLLFEVAPELLGGVELTTDGHKLAWNIEDYLTNLEDSMQTLLVPKETNDGPAT